MASMMTPTRRECWHAAAGAAVIASGAASAQPAPAERVKGPLVWLDMDQKELDDAYDQAVYAPNRDIVIKRCIRNSELARAASRRAEALRLRADLVRRASTCSPPRRRTRRS